MNIKKAAFIASTAALVLGVILAANARAGIDYDYRRAEACLERLSADVKKQKYRHHWMNCIRRFQAVYRAQPDGSKADDAIYRIARLYEGLYGYSDKPQDREEARDHYRRLLKRFPRSPYNTRAKKALSALGASVSYSKKKKPNTAIVVKKGVVKNGRVLNSKKESPRLEKPKNKNNGVSKVKDVRVWSNPSYTRVVIDVEDTVQYAHRLLKKDPSIKKPQRLYVDLIGTRMGSDMKKFVPIGDDLVSDVRAGQYAKETVRVVVDIKSIEDYNIFSLQNPFRVVLDVNGSSKNQGPAKKTKRPKKAPVAIQSPSLNPSLNPSLKGPVPKGALARQLALGVRRIVIDPGHGGKDPGAIGYDRKVLEKNVTLEVARRLKKKVRHELGLEAILTRNSDVFLSLEERTAIANTKNGDLFVSIHANASRSRKTRGIETYFLNLATDEEAIMVAARENATSEKNISDLESILNDLMKNAKIDESSRLADHIQKAMAAELKKKYGYVRNHGVKQAPFYVLLGAKMPSILVEISFISHPRECRLLNTAAYQDVIADALVAGIRTYIRETEPTTVKRSTKRYEARR